MVSLLLGCGGESEERSGGSGDGDSVVIALDPGSEPEAGLTRPMDGEPESMSTNH